MVREEEGVRVCVCVCVFVLLYRDLHQHSTFMYIISGDSFAEKKTNRPRSIYGLRSEGEATQTPQEVLGAWHMMVFCLNVSNCACRLH